MNDKSSFAAPLALILGNSSKDFSLPHFLQIFIRLKGVLMFPYFIFSNSYHKSYFMTGGDYATYTFK